ncbi:hypothetical protein EVJ58_g683 [Rhodofomes roseus]|uniref:F-box domain-containing protein n=1 Tax=Rhodofomes roseus TaxID=34475 RepID=A0A4Y9Z2A0_9APHY|nr:hypothetical protein EVJ58_g683 [Rhodofomes roseus]
MSLLSLNHDVLYLIVDLLPRQACLALSSVSRGCHRIARRKAFTYIQLSTSAQLVKMHDTLIHNIDNRLIWPRKLNIDTHKIMSREAGIVALAGILEHAWDLEVLRLPYISWIASDERFRKSFIALPKLSELHLELGQEDTIADLCRMVSRPKTLHLGFAPYTTSEHAVLVTQAAALDDVKDLFLTGFRLRPVFNLHSTPMKAYPQLESLTLHNSDLYASLTLFPGIRRLFVPRVFFLTHPGPPVPRRPWRHLDHLRVRVLDLHHFSTFRCHALTLDLTPCSNIPAESDTGVVSTAAVVTCDWDHQDLDAECFMALAQMISTKSSRVRYLVLKFWSLTLAVQCMEIMPAVLASSQVIAIHCSVRKALKGGWRVTQQHEKALVSAIPGLRFYCKHYDDRAQEYDEVLSSHTDWGRVESDGDTRVVRPIAGWMGERIHRYLQSPGFCETLRFDEDEALRYTGR